MKKYISLILVVVIVLPLYSVVFAETEISSEPVIGSSSSKDVAGSEAKMLEGMKEAASPAVVEAYLISAGFPEDVISIIADEVKLDIYNSKGVYDGGTVEYGIFTKDYNISYSVVDGNLEMYGASIEEFYDFMDDAVAQRDVLKALRKEGSEKFVDAKKISGDATLDNKAIAALASFTNYSRTVSVVNLGYDGTYSNKQFIFSFRWNYDPGYCQQDFVGVAWSGGYAFDPYSVRFIYEVDARHLYDNSSYSTTVESKSGTKAIYDNDPSTGIGYRYNFVNLVTGPKGAAHVHTQRVTYSVQAKKQDSSSQAYHAKGSYFHQISRISGAIGLGFSASGPSISISPRAESSFDRAPDGSARFYNR
ncbi:hypothetical protein LJC27_05580 [Christensenellaceae bacterium OttesenSCG-928-M15]|nr:hypothetical protein [Christensenellaceae bacterium OttesenSCG-928-M15]